MNVNENSRLGMVIALILNFVLQFIAPGGIVYLISLINALQIILHLPIKGVQEPANVLDTFSNILPITGFDIIDALDIPWLRDVVHSKDENLDEINICDQVISLGYETHNPILNIGFMSVMLNLYYIKLIFFLFFMWPMSKRVKKLKRAVNKMKT